MARMICDFVSSTLRISTSMTVLMPQSTAPGNAGTGESGKGVPVLYLLHGLTDDDSMWTRNTSIERYASERGIAVVMPQAAHSFYADEAQGLPYWTFLTQELPELVSSFFRVSTVREDTFVAGLSMGGYGALKWALHEPHRFAFAASLSGVTALDGTAPDGDPWVQGILDRVFGGNTFAGTGNDLLHLLETVTPAELPQLLVTCGTGDFLYPQNVRFVEAARHLGIDPQVDFGPGDHDWGYWDTGIQQVIDLLPIPR